MGLRLSGRTKRPRKTGQGSQALFLHLRILPKPGWGRLPLLASPATHVPVTTTAAAGHVLALYTVTESGLHFPKNLLGVTGRVEAAFVVGATSPCPKVQSRARVAPCCFEDPRKSVLVGWRTG